MGERGPDESGAHVVIRRRAVARRPRVRVWLLAAVVIALVLAALGYLVTRGDVSPRTSVTSSGGDNTAGIPTTYASLGASGTHTPTGGGTVLTGTVNPGGVSTLTGLTGNGFAHSEESHTVVLRAWSTAPIPGLGWWVPTAHARGNIHGAPREWSRTFTAYGPPKYAQLYLVTDYRGIRVHCSITVDGVVKASGQSSGPFGDVMCIG